MPKKKTVTAAAAQKKAAKKAKVEKKAEKRDTKKAKPEGDEEDLDAILQKLAKDWEVKHKVNEETVAGPPSKRANATLTPCPNGNHLWFIGGEYFSEDGKAYFYNDVYRYTPDKDEWRCYTSPNSPGPRSAHSVVASPAGGGKLFLFGGEFSSLSQNTFHHYRDFWVFDVTAHSWERIETKVKPSARSGHRMALWKHFIVLFGGFVDIGVRTNYLNDVWIFDTQEYKWAQVEFGPHDRQPQPRSGCSFLPIAEGFVMHGGYTKTYAQGKRPVGVALEDTWFLKMSTTHKEIKWEKRKKIGYAPTPSRSGCTMALWPAKSQGVLFGGVSDVDKDEEQLDSVFYADMYAYQTAGNGRWLSINLKNKKKSGGAKKKQSTQPVPRIEDSMDVDEQPEGEEQADDGSGDENMEPPIAGPSTVMAPIETPAVVPSVFATDPDKPASPFARYNAMLAVLRNTLYIYGGIYETGSKEYTLDDFWAIQLDKMDAFTCLRPLDVEINPDDGSDSSDDDDEGDDEDEEDGDDGEGGDHAEEMEPEEDEEADVNMKAVVVPTQEELQRLREKANEFLGSSRDTNRSAEEQISTPLPGETLAVFYARSNQYWAQKAHEYSDNRGKLLRRDGFALAEEKYATYKPILEEVEKILSEAGLDEADIKRAGASGGLPSTSSRNRR